MRWASHIKSIGEAKKFYIEKPEGKAVTWGFGRSREGNAIN
jgi:hypothetical protein